jgi:hypothetical protein
MPHIPHIPHNRRANLRKDGFLGAVFGLDRL